MARYAIALSTIACVTATAFFVAETFAPHVVERAYVLLYAVSTAI